MPILYILGFIFFFGSYMTYKYLLITFHRTSYGFDEEVPMLSVGLMKWALFFHLIMNLFMYTNVRLLTPPGYDTEIHYRP
jgi:hypothetical protein